jgi:hypothetical protein
MSASFPQSSFASHAPLRLSAAISVIQCTPDSFHILLDFISFVGYEKSAILLERDMS